MQVESINLTKLQREELFILDWEEKKQQEGQLVDDCTKNPTEQ